jgi:hypothetical protein
MRARSADRWPLGAFISAVDGIRNLTGVTGLFFQGNNDHGSRGTSRSGALSGPDAPRDMRSP